MSRTLFNGQRALLMLVMVLGLAACATQQPFDYTEYRKARPASILVLTPVNQALDVKASNSLLSYATLPLAEAGYYVFPVGVAYDTFRQNGLSTPEDVHAVSVSKLHDIFGADAALYVTVTQYGTKYAVLASNTIVAASAKLVDLRSGAVLWTGSASAAADEGQNNNGGLVGLLVKAVVNQIINSATDRSHQVAAVTSQRLLSPRTNGVLYGPRSPMYGKDGTPP
jgi:hypothetical protein